MKAAVFYGKEHIQTEEIPLRGISGDEVLIKVAACGVCGTDIHIYYGEEGSAPVSPPIVLGHELSGEVISVGADVVGLAQGDRVTVDPNIYCGRCHYCLNGKKQMCTSLSAVGVNFNGGFAQYCIVPSAQVYKIDDSVSYEAAALIEPLACCLHGIDIIDVKAGETACIIGGGAIGLIMLQLLKRSGVSFAAVSEPLEARAKKAIELGADAVVNPLNGNIADELRAYVPEGFDITIECAGKSAAVNDAVNTAKKGGRVLMFSVPSPDATIQLKPFEIFKKELTIKGSFVNPSTHGRATALVNAGMLKLDTLITHRFGLEELEDAIKAQQSPDAVKVLVLPDAPSL